MACPRFRGEDAISELINHYAACREVFSQDRYFAESISRIPVPTAASKALNVEIKWWGVSNANNGIPFHPSGNTTLAATAPEGAGQHLRDTSGSAEPPHLDDLSRAQRCA